MEWSKYVYYDESSPSGLRPVHGGSYGAINSRGYWLVNIRRKPFRAHRVIFELLNQCCILPGYEIDHIDGNKVNNKVSNLRVCSRRGNVINKCKQSNNTSGITGVSYNYKKQYWQGSWSDVNGRSTSRCFSCALYEDAFERACKARQEGIEYMKSLGIEYTERHGL